MSRTRFLISYDICDPRRLRSVAKTLEGYGNRVQYSMFECSLDDSLLAEARAELDHLINHTEDQILFISLGGEQKDVDLIIKSLGLPYFVRDIVNIV